MARKFYFEKRNVRQAPVRRQRISCISSMNTLNVVPPQHRYQGASLQHTSMAPMCYFPIGQDFGAISHWAVLLTFSIEIRDCPLTHEALCHLVCGLRKRELARPLTSVTSWLITFTESTRAERADLLAGTPRPAFSGTDGGQKGRICDHSVAALMEAKVCRPVVWANSYCRLRRNTTVETLRHDWWFYRYRIWPTQTLPDYCCTYETLGTSITRSLLWL